MIAVCAALIGLVWLVFGQTLGHQFVQYDDDPYVYNNPVVKRGLTLDGIGWAFTHAHSTNWHPVTTISHMLDCQLFGLNPGGHHFTSVLLHGVTAALLFLALWQLTNAMWRSAVVAAIFAVHPLRVESVAWIAERKDVLSGLFFVLTVIAYTRYVRAPTTKRYLAVALLFALGLMSKSMVMTLPFVLFFLDYWPLHRFSRRGRSVGRLILEKVPLLVLSAVAGAVTLLVQSQEINRLRNPMQLQISNAFVSYVTYLWQMVWPARLAVFYPLPSPGDLGIGKVILAIAFLAVVSAIVVGLRRAYPYLLTGWLWYICMLLPVIGLVQVGWQSHADRYTYLPQIGIYIALTWLIADVTASLPYRRELLGGAVGIVLIGLSGAAWAQTRSWRDTGTLWRHALAVTSNNYIAHHNLGFFLWTGDEAAEHFAEAIRLQPGYASAHHNLARIELGKGEIDDAITHLEATLAIEPENAAACSDLGNALLLKGQAGKAIAYFSRALQLQPDMAIASNNLAWVFATCTDDSLRNGARAVELSQKAVELSHSENATFLRTLGAALAEAGRFEDATRAAQQALQLATVQNNVRLSERLRTDIDLYETRLPCRDPSLTGER